MSEECRTSGGDDLRRNSANFAPLTPLTFIRWSAHACPNRTAVIHGGPPLYVERNLRTVPPARLGASHAGNRCGRYSCRDALEYPGNV